MKLTFQRCQPEIADIATFIFTPAEPIHWLAGQSIRLDLPAGWGSAERRFTISSAPYENYVAITTRRSPSEFKQALWALRPGAEITGYAIEGDFTWQDAPLPKLFIASGIGSTPFYAMLKQRAYQGEPVPVTFVYASRQPQLLFGETFNQWKHTYPEFNFHFLPGERLGVAAIQKLVSDFSRYQVYIAGPEAMVSGLSAGLQSLGLPETQLRTDLFTGRLSPDD
jgi:ferredoxin-NADP reductase